MSTSATSFTHPTSSATIHLPSASSLTREQLLTFKPFSSWLFTLTHNLSLQHTNKTHTFHSDPYNLQSIIVQSVDYFGPPPNQRIGFIKLQALIKNAAGESLPGSVFLRGGSVVILLILESDGESWAVLTVQPRIPAGSLEMVDLPAGMIDESGTFAGAAAKEIQEECGIEIPADGLVDLTSLSVAGRGQGMSDERLEEAVYPSPGGSDEFMKIFMYKHKIKKGTLKDWQGKLTGLRSHAEKITLKVVKLEDLWKETMDSKALSAVALYEGLQREGKV